MNRLMHMIQESNEVTKKLIAGTMEIGEVQAYVRLLNSQIKTIKEEMITGDLDFIKTSNGNIEVNDVLEAIDLNVMGSIRFAAHEIEENIGPELGDAIATIRTALTVFDHIDHEARQRTKVG